MKYKQSIPFSLDGGMRPNVLLFGNGLVRGQGENGNWSDVLSKLANPDSAELLLKSNDPLVVNSEKIPYTVKSTVLLSTDDCKRRKGYISWFCGNGEDGKHYMYNELPILKKILYLPFDAILTTNYTFEAENAILSSFSDISKDSKLKYVCSTRGREKNQKDKFGLFRYYRFQDGSTSKNIWHIHGELRNKSSIVFTHDEYSRLLASLVDYNRELGKKYVDFSNEFRFKSWYDYLILGNVYIVGLGMDFSEFDLWWLINRKRRETLIDPGKVIFYNPIKEGKEREKDELIEAALRGFGVEIENCGIEFKNMPLDLNSKYSCFYSNVIKDIRDRM